MNDIKFYVLYAVYAQLCSNVYPNNKQVSGIEKESVSPAVLDTSIDLVFDLYKVMGGNDKIAKGTKFIEALKDKLREKKL
ncbi:hypothetical protein P9314_11035 [Paenibacillus validus]|nr:hypothetical protein [Paenibacillus validus]MED4607499.1 hypothetical protein [Paenibacillus validus]